jgi:thioredoxin-like negative regulator of GroEL
MMVPILDQLSSHLREQLQVVKVDTDKYPALASQYGIQALPTLVLFKQGLPVHRMEGVQQAGQLIQQLQGFL